MNEREMAEKLDDIRSSISEIIKGLDPDFDKADEGQPFTEDFLAYEQKSYDMAQAGLALRCGTCENCSMGFEYVMNSGEQRKRVRCMKCYHINSVRRN